MLSGTNVDLGWGWGGFGAFLDAHEIQVELSDGKGYVHLVSDTTPNYTDTTPHPATPMLWKYHNIYRIGVTEVPQDWVTKATNLGLANVTAGVWVGNQPAAGHGETRPW